MKKIADLFRKDLRLVTGMIMWMITYLRIIVCYGRHGEMFLHSDASAEMVLANLLNKEHRFMTPDWFYSTELRVLNTQFIYKPALYIFHDNWHAARVASIAVFLLLMTLSCLLLGKLVHSLGAGFWIAFLSIAPLGKWTANNISFHCYYVPHVLITTVSVSLFILVCRSIEAGSKTKAVLYSALLIALGFTGGLGGVRIPVVLCFPLFASSFILFLIKTDDGLRKKRTVRMMISFTTLLASALGYLVNSKILSSRYSYHSFEDTRLHVFSPSALIDSLGQFAEQLGYRKDVPALSLEGVGSALALIMWALVIAGFVILISSKTKNETEKVLVSFSGCAFLFLLLILAAPGGTNDSYLIPITPFLFAVMLSGLEKMKKSLHVEYLYALVAAAVIVCTRLTLMDPMPDSIPQTAPIKTAYEFIEKQGYTAGMGTFWNTHVITEWSDGKIETWPITNFVLASQPGWLNIRRDTKFPEGRFFIIASWDELEGQGIDSSILAQVAVYADENFLICEFENGEQYESILGNVYSG